MLKNQKNIQDLNEIIQNALEYSNFEKNKNELEKIILDKNSDDEMKELAKSELDDLEKT